MPKPKVYREYFPSCIERFFGSGKPRRLKARCFVPYTQQEQNTDVYLGPTREAPNIDLNMTVRKDKYGRLTAFPDGEGYGSYGPCSDRGQQMYTEDPHNPPQYGSSRTLDCGCSCRCSETGSTSSTTSSSNTSPKTKSNFTTIKPKMLILDEDGRYRPVDEEFLEAAEIHSGQKKSKTKSTKTSTAKPKLIVRGKKVDVAEHTEDEVSIIPAECGLDICTKEKSKNGVVLGYVMYDPESEDKRPYVTTTDGKRITHDLRSC